MKKIIWQVKENKIYKGYRKLAVLDNGRYAVSSLAYFLFISLLPLLTIFVIVLSFFNIPQEYILQLLRVFLPINLEIVDHILEHLRHIAWTDIFSLGFSFFVAIYMSSRGVEIIVNFADSVYGYTEISEKTIKKKVRSIVFTLTVLLSLGFVISAYLTLESWTKTLIPKEWIMWLKFPVLLIMFTLLLFTIMIFTPHKRQKLSTVYRGAFFSAFSISFMISGFMIYITYFNDYTTIYGPIAAVIILLLLFYFCSYLLLIGIYINAIKAKNEKIFS